jgi:predicted DNA-binding protein (MmcQ/YjbR family)
MMTADEILSYCLLKKGAYIDYPFGDIPVCVRVKAGNRTPIFVQLYPLEKDYKVTVKCGAPEALFYRNLYPDAVKRGYFCPPVQQPYWNTITLDGRVPDKELKLMFDHAYEQVIKKLPKYLQNEFI